MTESKSRTAVEWPPAPGTIRREPAQIHLWAAGVEEFARYLQTFETLLSDSERGKAGAFRFAKDRDRYVIRHGLLRLILRRYVGQPAAEIQFQYGKHGKPEIILERNGPLFFNASDSGNIAVWAVTPACPVGVDIESIQPISDARGVARHFFVERETATLEALPADAQLAAFYSCWTRKEALLKATGEGITESLKKVEVTVAPDDPPGVASISGDAQAGREWQLQPFSPASGYLGCLAYRNAPLLVFHWRVSESVL